ncbi:MAG: PAS domain-containing protein [Betaproteobacteria bacterium]
MARWPVAGPYAAVIGFVMFAVLLRWALDPWLGARLPFVTMFASVAASVWLGGARPAILAAVLGYVAGEFFFDESRAAVNLDAGSLTSAAIYALSCGLIIALGEAARRAHAHVEAPRQELQSIFDAAPVAILVAHDRQCRSITGNHFAYNLLGLSGGNISRTAPQGERMRYRILRNGVELPVESLPLQRATAEDCALSDQELEFVFEGRASVHVTGSAVPLHDEEGRVRGAIAVYTDITERKRAEQLLRLLTDNIPALIAYVDRDFRYRLNNRVFGEWFGPDRTDVTGRRVAEVLGEKGWEKVRPYLEKALAGERVSFEIEIITRDRLRWVSAAYVPHIGPTGAVEGLALFANDLTERHAAEQALHRSENAQRLLLALHDATRGLSDPARIMLETVNHVGRHFGVIRCAYGEVDAAQENLLVMRGYTVGVPSVAGKHPLDSFGVGFIAELKAGRTVVIDDIASDWRTAGHRAQATYAGMELRSLICVPLVKDGRFAGLLVMGDRAPRQWSEENARLLEQIAERTWLALENARAEAALREADRRKDEFLATLAHELRNPLAPIRTAVEIVQRLAPDDARLRAPLDIVDRQVRHMTRLVDDLLDVARITRGKIHLRRQAIDLSGVLREALDSARGVIAQAGHTLEVQLAPEPIQVNADATRLTQIVYNLLSNASKFTPRGGHLHLASRREGSLAVISVRDDGRGIEAEHLPQLFEMFSQLSPALERTEQGLGIGLALVRGLVEQHGGNVEARSAGPGQGSEFIVRLPLSVAAAPVIAAGEAASEKDDGPRRQVLIVDDNRDAADSLAAILDIMGHATEVAYDGRSALARVEARHFDAVLLDIGMPGLNGYEVAQRIRKLPQGGSLLLVALTGWGQEEDRRLAADAGFDRHLTKPVDVAVVAALLRGTDSTAGDAQRLP